MLRPIGSRSPTVYWRRRLLMLATVGLAALTVYVIFVSGDRNKQAGQPGGGTTQQSTPGSPTATATTQTVPRPVSCVPAVLKVVARTQAARYHVGQQPDLEIQVTNIGRVPCTADLSDAQIEMLVYNGEARVWSSHDCAIAPGHRVVTLMAAKVVRRSIQWTARSSLPRCAGTRPRVGAGTYTLRARLGQVQATPDTFLITP